MRNLFVLCLIFALSQGQTSNVCEVSQCSAIGQACAPSNPPGQRPTTCNSCLTVFGECTSEAFSTSNFALACNCYLDLQRCLSSVGLCGNLTDVVVEDCIEKFPFPTFPMDFCPCQELAVTNEISCGFEGFCGSSGVCEPRKSLGSSCVRDSECIDLVSAGLEIIQSTVCLNGICMLGNNQAQAGDPCVEDFQCVGNFLCSNGICSAQSQAGERCSGLDCALGLFCSINGMCEVQLSEGTSCLSAALPGMNPCSFPFECIDGTCQKMFSVPVGEACSGSNMCQVGSFCMLPAGVCSPLPTQLIPCDHDSDCITTFGTSGTCQCSPFSPVQFCHLNTQPDSVLPPLYAPYTQGAMDTLLNCYQSFECFSFGFAPTSCGVRFCPEDTACLLAALETFGPFSNLAIESGCRDLSLLQNLTAACNATGVGGRTTGATEGTSEGATSGAASTGQSSTGGGGEFVCDDEACCIQHQNPNPETGAGYLQFRASCLQGGLHCVDSTGCQLCWNPAGTTNLGNRPICDRFA